MSVAIVTDTNSGISPAEGEKLGIYVLPMPVIIDDASYNEHENITHPELYEAFRAHKNISSSQPAPGCVLDLWERALSDGNDEVVYIPMSSGLSSSCTNAKAMSEDYDGRVFVVDNHRISVTMRQSVMDAMALRDAGLSGKEIMETLEAHALDASIYISVNTLEYLKKSGRVTAAAAAIATVVNLKPVLTIQGGKLDSFAKVKGMKAASRKMIAAIRKDLEERFANIPQDRIDIRAAGTLETQEEIDACLNNLNQEFPDYTIGYDPLACNIATHVGIGAIGAAISVKVQA